MIIEEEKENEQEAEDELPLQARPENPKLFTCKRVTIGTIMLGFTVLATCVDLAEITSVWHIENEAHSPTDSDSYLINKAQKDDLCENDLNELEPLIQ